MALAMVRYGLTPAAVYAAGAARHPDRIAVIDDDGETTYAEIDQRSNAIAHALADRGVEAGHRVGLLARNSAEYVVATVALGKVGATVVHLNTGFAGPAMARALDDEDVAAVIYDSEFADLLREGLEKRPSIVTGEFDAFALGDASRPPSPSAAGGQIILTSGTTGRAKGAERGAPGGMGGVEMLTALLTAIPLRAGEPTVVAAPMFHTWGFAHLVLGGLLGSTLVVRRRFDAAATLGDIERTKATVLVVVPVMLQRMVDLPEDERRQDTSSLRA